MQKINREGFTLIELLAVIIILAVIALIAIPEVIDIIAKARKSAFEDSIYGIIRAGEMYYTNELLENGGMSEDKEFIIKDGKFEGDKLPISGSLPNSGKVKVTSDGDVAIVLSDGKYYVQKTTTESEFEVRSLKEDKIKEEELDYKEETSKVNIFTTSTLNPSIPACITNNTECEAGTGVAIKVNNTQTYDFYVMSDNTEDNEITLLMSENLGDPVSWTSRVCDNSEGPVGALAYLESQTSSWTNIPEETYILMDDNVTPVYSPITRTNARARLITYTEANALLSLSNNSWVYGNLSSSSNLYGYWTSTACLDYEFSAASVKYDGRVGSFVDSVCSNDVTYEYSGGGYGIRPVITISKSTL